MAKQRKRTEQEIRDRSDARLQDMAQPCLHCIHRVSMGTLFDQEGWTCKAYPSHIPYTTLTLRDPHTEPRGTQEGDYVYTPRIYREDGTGRRWHYNADGSWQYLEDE